MFVTVFKDEITLGIDDIPREDFVRYGLQPLQSIRRIGKNKVELLVTDIQEIEHVVTYHSDVGKAQTLGLGLDETGIFTGHFDAVHAGSSPGSEFE